MRYKPKVWQLILLIAAICALSIWGVSAYRSRNLTPAALLRRMPVQSSVVLYVDFSQLRAAGILQLLDGSKVGEDPEYQAFVRKTDFDYKQDLDTAMVGFAPEGKFLLVKGRFDWRSLRSYVQAGDGDCYNSVCKMPGSTPDRHISFFPLQSNVMAMAVSPDATAALRLQGIAGGPAPEVPAAPVWVSIPAAVLKGRDALPDGTRMFARSLEGAENVTLAFTPEGKRLSARLYVRCSSEQDAAAAAAQLSKATVLLREAIAREHQAPNPADLSGVLASGAFRTDGRQVLGYWPIERAFVENVLAGGS